MARTPFPASLTVREARDAYLAENGFTVAAYDEAWTDASFFGIKFAVPNTKSHRVAIMLHDLHHVATGFGTDLVGEGEISAWEARRGLGPLGLYVGGIVVSGGLMGLLLAPRRAARAFRASSRAPSLFPLAKARDFTERYEALLSMTVGDLRKTLGVPPQGATREPRNLHAYAPREA